MPIGKSQFDVCGYARMTDFGPGGGTNTLRQPISHKIAVASRRSIPDKPRPAYSMPWLDRYSS